MVATMLGKPFMAWQQMVADVVLELDPDTGELVYDEWILTVPRQSGKSTFILAKAVHRASATKFFGSRQQVVYTAQTRKDARKKWEEDFAPDLEHARRFRGRFNNHKGNGNEHTRFTNGSRFGIESTTEKSGHGPTLDEAYIDEAFAQIDNRLEQAFGPAMITRRNKQLGVISTAGWLDASPYLLEKVRIGRQLVLANVRRGTAYFEWSAPEDANPADEAVWLGCMPALHRPGCPHGCREHTVTIAAIRSEFQKAQLSGKMSDFRRAYLNQWVPKPREAQETAVGDWAGSAGAVASFPKPLALGVAMSVDRDWGSIGAAALLEDGRTIISGVERQPDRPADGDSGALTAEDWLLAETTRMHREQGCPIVIDEKGPAKGLIKPLREDGVEVIAAKLEDYIDACAGLTNAVKARSLVHPHNPDLDDAVKGARWRMVGDRKVFGRKTSETDISMLEAVTLAWWQAAQSALPEPNIF